MGISRVLDFTSQEAGEFLENLLEGPAPDNFSEVEIDALNSIKQVRVKSDKIKQSILQHKKEIGNLEKEIQFLEGQFNAYFNLLVSAENRRRNEITES